ncbi:glycoside hydrolase family 3 N-terminal domain-containing protein [Gandjariella thermophila]|nr:glycoside hydrolase family 3 N-terminal domain-containing protein [Gandjariella thermophila]
MRRIRTARTVLAALAAVALTTTLAQSSGQAEPATGQLYQDAAAPVDRRADDLLHRMTLEEKVGQMVQIRVGKLRGDCQWTAGPLREDCMKTVLADDKVGSILSGGGDFPVPDNTPQAWAEMTNAVQRYALEHSRLKIPVLYGADGVHGHNNLITATLFPQQIGVGATWDPALATQLGESTSKAMRATGVLWDFAPVSDVARDTRWGRYYETFSEDPLLAGTMAAADVRGLQTNRDKKTADLTATAKHFAGYSQPANGHDRVPAQLPVRYLQDQFLPSFQAQFDAGVGTVMADSGAVNGVPVHASKFMLTTELRQRMGFTGVVVSDWQDVRALVDSYHVAADYPTAIAMAVNAGVDMAMEPSEASEFTQDLIQDVHKGLVSQQRIDEAVRRILTLKFRLGLFEKPYVDASAANGIVNGADRDLARRAATESAVLLKNDHNVLPLAKSVGRLVITGDAADSPSEQFGGWTVNWQGLTSDSGPTPPVVTVLQGVREAVGADHVVAASDQASAVAATKSADAALVVLGEKPGAEGLNDSESPALTADQQALVSALKATGKPVIVVLETGRPLVLGAAANADALLEGWLPGSEGGHAIADVLFGAANPSGRLPVSWPKTVGDEPMSYDQLPGTNGGTSSNYDPQFPFGHGLSYTSFTTSAPSVPSQVDAGGRVTVRVTVRNTGSVAGTDVVPVYVHQPVSPVLVPERRLVGFARVDLAPGEQRTVDLTFAVSQLAVTTGDVDASGRREVERGGYEVVVGDARAPFTVR